MNSFSVERVVAAGIEMDKASATPPGPFLIYFSPLFINNMPPYSNATKLAQEKRRVCQSNCKRPQEYVTAKSGQGVKDQWDEFEACYRRCLAQTPYTPEEEEERKHIPGGPPPSRRTSRKSRKNRRSRRRRN
jgi:hypothetical protein